MGITKGLLTFRFKLLSSLIAALLTRYVCLTNTVTWKLRTQLRIKIHLILTVCTFIIRALFLLALFCYLTSFIRISMPARPLNVSWGLQVPVAFSHISCHYNIIDCLIWYTIGCSYNVLLVSDLCASEQCVCPSREALRKDGQLTVTCRIRRRCLKGARWRKNNTRDALVCPWEMLNFSSE